MFVMTIIFNMEKSFLHQSEKFQFNSYTGRHFHFFVLVMDIAYCLNSHMATDWLLFGILSIFFALFIR